ncbi:MAG: hypothetical protein GXO39_06880 [Thermotogae bacterium]|nr:hypothetical protein [Thermotogota bacterium]
MVVSYDGKGLGAVRPDTVVGKLRISMLTDYGEEEFSFKRSVHFGTLVMGSNAYVMDPDAVAILETEIGKPLKEAKLRVHHVIKKLKMPPKVSMLEPSKDLPDWDALRVTWRGSSSRYVVRLYAFTMMYQKDEMVLVDSTAYIFDLGSFYGDGFLSVMVCPVEGDPPTSKRRIKVFAVGKCASHTLIVGNAEVWGDERPTPPWNEDDILWYLLTL